MYDIIVVALEKLVTEQRLGKRYTRREIVEWCLGHAFRGGLIESDKLTRQGYKLTLVAGRREWHKSF